MGVLRRCSPFLIVLAAVMPSNVRGQQRPSVEGVWVAVRADPLAGYQHLLGRKVSIVAKVGDDYEVTYSSGVSVSFSGSRLQIAMTETRPIVTDDMLTLSGNPNLSIIRKETAGITYPHMTSYSLSSDGALLTRSEDNCIVSFDARGHYTRHEHVRGYADGLDVDTHEARN